MYAYSFWKICHPVRLLQTVRLLETLEYNMHLDMGFAHVYMHRITDAIHKDL